MVCRGSRRRQGVLEAAVPREPQGHRTDARREARGHHLAGQPDPLALGRAAAGDRRPHRRQANRRTRRRRAAIRRGSNVVVVPAGRRKSRSRHPGIQRFPRTGEQDSSPCRFTHRPLLAEHAPPGLGGTPGRVDRSAAPEACALHQLSNLRWHALGVPESRTTSWQRQGGLLGPMVPAASTRGAPRGGRRPRAGQTPDGASSPIQGRVGHQVGCLLRGRQLLREGAGRGASARDLPGSPNSSHQETTW
jgi:hypothetical protein